MASSAGVLGVSGVELPKLLGDREFGMLRIGLLSPWEGLFDLAITGDGGWMRRK
jgi:hypothetical protein